MDLPVIKEHSKEFAFEYLIYFTDQDSEHGIKRTSFFFVTTLLAICFEDLVPFLFAHEKSREKHTICAVTASHELPGEALEI